MSDAQFLETSQGRRLAYHHTEGSGPCVVFLGGLKSDMEGMKAIHLEAWCKARGQAFLRFDYSGHGESSGTFEEGCIGDWAEDTGAALSALTTGKLVVVGSSMGGWQALLYARANPERIAGLVTVAAAPDFTEDGYWASFSDAQKATLARDGQIAMPSDYMEPYIITHRLIEDGRANLVLRAPLSLPFPVRCLQGTADTAVSTETALRLLDHADCPDMRLNLVKDADHRFSDGPCLGLIEAAICDVMAVRAAPEPKTVHMEQHVSMIKLVARDVDKLAGFYKSLGWKQLDASDGVAAFDLLGQTLGIFSLEALAEEIGVPEDVLGRGAAALVQNAPSKEEVGSILARVEAAGARILKEAQDVAHGGHHGYFSDPEGHIWKVAWHPDAASHHQDGPA